MIKNIILIGIVAVGLAGCSQAIVEKQDSISEKSKISNEVTNTNNAPETIAESGQTPIFTSFTQERYSELLGKKPFVIFFHANWCSICTELTKDINKDLANFPEGTIILQANYDTESRLKQNYDVAIQSTIVVIDKTGKVVQSLLGPSIDDLKTAITQSL